MQLFKRTQIILGFLTRIPTRIQIQSLEEVAQNMWLFPLIGAIVGILTGFLGWGLSYIFPIWLCGFLILGFLLWITGGHHTDGLLDFGDGIMVHGDPAKKIAVMHDVSTGTGGFVLGFIVLSITAMSIAYLDKYLLLALILAEISAKYSMHFACVLGPSAKTPMAESFIRLNSKKHFFFSTSLSIVLMILILYVYLQFAFNLPLFITIFTIFFSASCVSTFFIVSIARKHFAGITGDCLGALNEIARATTLLFFVAAIQLHFL